MAGKNLLVFLSAAAAGLLSVVLFPKNPRNLTEWMESKWGNKEVMAELVIRNATIYTADPSVLFAEAMAITGGRILRIGNYSTIEGLVGHGTMDLNLNRKVVVPGFIDSHTHFLYGGLQMARVQLRDVKSQDDFIQRVKEAVRDRSPGEWVLGGGWNNDFWVGDLPTASWIDDVSRENPVWLSRMDGHMGLANSLALQLAGVSNTTQDPIGGTIMKCVNGEPSGLLVDSASKLVEDVIPVVSIHDRRDALLRASKYALTKGVTTVIDLGRYIPGESTKHVWDDLSEIYQWADSSGKMLVRVCLYFPMPTWSKLVDLIKERGRALSQWVYLGGVKAFEDGSLGSHSALFYEPYEDDPNDYGLQVTDYEWLQNMTLASDKSGLQVAIHAIGDKANDLVLDLYKSVETSNGPRDRRFRIEHAQHLVPKSVPRFGQQGVIASVQPDHLLDDAASVEKKIGVTRAQTESYLFQSLLSGGARLAFGSDWPVADINPLHAIRTAMMRITPGQEAPWIPTERIQLKDALLSYTSSASYSSFMDHEVGSLSPGKFADFVELPVTWDEFVEDVPSTVQATYVGGVKAYP